MGVWGGGQDGRDGVPDRGGIWGARTGDTGCLDRGRERQASASARAVAHEVPRNTLGTVQRTPRRPKKSPHASPPCALLGFSPRDSSHLVDLLLLLCSNLPLAPWAAERSRPAAPGHSARDTGRLCRCRPRRTFLRAPRTGARGHAHFRDALRLSNCARLHGHACSICVGPLACNHSTAASHGASAKTGTWHACFAPPRASQCRSCRSVA